MFYDKDDNMIMIDKYLLDYNKLIHDIDTDHQRYKCLLYLMNIQLLYNNTYKLVASLNVKFSGPVPLTLNLFTNIRYIKMNNFEGGKLSYILKSILFFNNVIHLDLSNNSLTYKIPKTLFDSMS